MRRSPALLSSIRQMMEKKKRGPALQNFLSQPFQLPVPSSQKLKVQESMKEIEEL